MGFSRDFVLRNPKFGEWLGHRLVEVIDEALDAVFEIGGGSEGSAPTPTTTSTSREPAPRPPKADRSGFEPQSKPPSLERSGIH
jgi:hypothetical protein